MTDTYGVIGDPIKQSKSPTIFNAAFKDLNIDAEYKAFHLKKEDLKSFFKQLRSKKIQGVNATIPYKQSIMPYLDELMPFAQDIGAVNTVFKKDKKLIGDNTDGRGYIQGLKEENSFEPKNTNVVVVGSGGASLAVCYTLCREGINSLTMVNRSLEKAEQIIQNLKIKFPNIFFQKCPLEQIQDIDLEHTDLFVNTTSLGMLNIDWPDLSFVEKLKSAAIVSDIVYNPVETPLIVKAKQSGLSVNHGYLMLLYQASIAFELFTNQKAPVAIMKKALLDSMGG